jgi:hypothetical protein
MSLFYPPRHLLGICPEQRFVVSYTKDRISLGETHDEREQLGRHPAVVLVRHGPNKRTKSAA